LQSKMTQEILSAGIFYFVLYYSLVFTGVPVMFFFLWTFFDFLKKNIWMVYMGMTLAFIGVPLAFFFTRQWWFLWFYPFSLPLQIAGFLIFWITFIAIMVAERSITFKVRFFIPLLQGKRVHLRMDGVYRYLRHPMYAVFPWMLLGALLYTGELILISPFLFNLMTRRWYALREEERLALQCDGNYAHYKNQTPYCFYPKLS